MEIEILNNIQWPEHYEPVKRRFECAGTSFCEYYANAHLLLDNSASSSSSSFYSESSNHSHSKILSNGNGREQEPIDSSMSRRTGSGINLLEEEDLSQLDYYQVLDILMGQARDKDLLKKVSLRS